MCVLLVHAAPSPVRQQTIATHSHCGACKPRPERVPERFRSPICRCSGVQKHAAEVPKGLDLSKYIASGVVAFDLRTRAVKWSTHLDLSTDSTTFRAYVYSSPTLADVDRDGKLEVVIGTSVVCCLSGTWRLTGKLIHFEKKKGKIYSFFLHLFLIRF